MLLECLVCEYLTLQNRARHEICPVCGWEDEGNESYTDNSSPTDGPNGDLSINEARENFRVKSNVDFGNYKRIIDLSVTELRSLRDQLQKETEQLNDENINVYTSSAVTQAAQRALLKKVNQLFLKDG